MEHYNMLLIDGELMIIRTADYSNAFGTRYCEIPHRNLGDLFSNTDMPELAGAVQGFVDAIYRTTHGDRESPVIMESGDFADVDAEIGRKYIIMEPYGIRLRIVPLGRANIEHELAYAGIRLVDYMSGDTLLKGSLQKNMQELEEQTQKSS